MIRLGEHFFSDYLLPFELASVLLLMAMMPKQWIQLDNFEQAYCKIM